MPPPNLLIAPTRTHHSLHVPSATVTRQVLLAESNKPTMTSPDFTNCTPSPSCTAPNIVVIELATTLRIPDFARFYYTPIESFHPSYNALPDGSLVSPPLISDIRTANAWLLVYSATAVFFLFNSLFSHRYIREGHVKKKTLFYLLFCSQILGLMAAIPMIVPFFTSSVNCTA